MLSKDIIITIKRASFLSLACVIIIFFGFISHKTNSDFKAIHISWVFQMLFNDELVPQRESADVFYSSDYLIARTRTYSSIGYTKLKPSTNEVWEEKEIIDTSYVYYVSRRNEKIGLAISSRGKPSPKDVDSFIRSTLTPPAFFYKLKAKGKDSISIDRDEKKGILIERYVFKRREIQEPDSLYFYFRKQPMVYSFPLNNRPSDNMYLYKTRAICNASTKGQFPNVNVDVRKYEHAFEITEREAPQLELQEVVEKFNKAKMNNN